MTENNLKNMIENHELDNLMTNGEELEKLKSSRTTEQVLEILKKYNYTETNEIFERELLEILQSMKLNEEEMKNVSGGRLMKTKNLSMVLGSLMALNSAGFMSAGAVTEKQKNTEKYSVGSLLNNVDTKTVEHIGLGAAVVGSLWVLKEIVTSRRDNKTFKLNSIQQRIYDNTETLSGMILTYVANYIEDNTTMPDDTLSTSDPDHQKILQLIKTIRKDWLTMYNNKGKITLTKEQTDTILRNEELDTDALSTCKVYIDEEAIEDLFYGLPVGNTDLLGGITPKSPADCTEDLDLLGRLWRLEVKFRKDFLTLTKEVPPPTDLEGDSE